MLQWCVELLRLTFEMLFEPSDGIIALTGASGGEDQCETLKGGARSNEFVD